MKTKQNKLNLFGTLSATILLVVLLFSCSKSEPENSVTNFKPADFEVYNLEYEQFTPEIIVVNCNVKNKTSRDYVENNANGYFEIYYKAKGSDGAWYDGDEDVPSLNAGASFGRELIINPPKGITLNTSTFSYEVRVKK